MIKVALGGGGVTGICHAGVLQAIYDRRVEISAMVGTSAGALFGVVYAVLLMEKRGDEIYEELIRIILETDFSKFQDVDIFNRLWSLVRNDARKFGLYKGKKLHKWLREMTHNMTFNDISLNLHITATEMSTGSLIVFNKENTPGVRLADAARASASIQGFFKPFKLKAELLQNAIYVDNDVKGEKFSEYEVTNKLAYKDKIYVWDGGNVGNCRNDIMLVTEPIVYPVLGCSLTYDGEQRKNMTVKDILTQTIDIMMMATEQVIDELSELRRVRDIFIHPSTLGLQTTEFDISIDKKKQLIEEGYREAERGLDILGF